MAGLEAEQKSRTAAIESDAAIKSRQAAMEAKNKIGALEAENLRQQNQRSQAVEESNNQLKLVRGAFCGISDVVCTSPPVVHMQHPV